MFLFYSIQFNRSIGPKFTHMSLSDIHPRKGAILKAGTGTSKRSDGEYWSRTLSQTDPWNMKV